MRALLLPALLGLTLALSPGARADAPRRGSSLEARFAEVEARDVAAALAVLRRQGPREAFAEAVRRAAGTPAAPRLSPEACLRLGLACLDAGLEAEARWLLLRAADAPTAAARAANGLFRLDFHLVAGRWVPPELDYPAKGYVRFEGRWLLPAEVWTIEAERARFAAERALARARAELAALRAEGGPDEAVAAARRALTEAEVALAAVERELQEAERARVLERLAR